MGATLTLLTTRRVGAAVVRCRRTRIRERVNACYGYAAIARIRVTQTARTGFAEPAGRLSRRRRPKRARPGRRARRRARRGAVTTPTCARRLKRSGRTY